ncbi:hypothetical protein EDD86DRAFT_201238 [Gorgonomyces haynaldii]|nr:hypothetical protein EDD86DRAFT_201238 [Gorgonomyces haynaldii]
MCTGRLLVLWVVVYFLFLQSSLESHALATVTKHSAMEQTVAWITCVGLIGTNAQLVQSACLLLGWIQSRYITRLNCTLFGTCF